MIKRVFSLSQELTGKKVIILGTGDNGKRAFYSLLQENVEIICFADRDINLDGKMILGKKIIHESKLKDYDCIVIVASLHWEDITQRLEKNGVKNYYIMNEGFVVNNGLNI